MNDKFTRFILLGILMCLIAIAFKPNKENPVMPAPNVSIDNTQQFIQIAPNRIGIIDNGIHSGNRGQLIIFNFDSDSKTFKYVETLKTSYILSHPEEFGIPVAK